MIRLKIHNPCNEQTRYFRYYNLFWDMLTHELQKQFIVEENRNFSRAHQESMQIFLQGGNTATEYVLHECDYVIENLDTNEFYALSVSDIPHSAILAERENPNLKKVLVAQFLESEIIIPESYGHVHEKDRHKYFPWIYFPQETLNLEQYFFKRKNYKPTNKQLFFKGNVGDRPIISHMPGDFIPTAKSTTSSVNEYLNLAITYKLGLSVGGRGEFCYRDVEYMALGIPFLRFEYKSKMYHPLIPNVHYISVPRPSDMKLDRMGQAHHAEMLMERYYEVIDDEDFLHHVATNARQYYEQYLCHPNNVKTTLDILAIGK